MRNFLIAFVLLNIPRLQAQNLIPNGSFEEQRDRHVLQWMQPTGNFYHFTEASARNGKAVSGNFFNGICLVNRSGSEYLEIKLQRTLVKGEKYQLGMYLKVDTGAIHNLKRIKSVDWLFLPNAVDVRTRVKVRTPPQVRFVFDTAKISEWTWMQAEYTASGGENYLLIGKFFQDADTIQRTLDSVKSDLIFVRKRVIMSEKDAMKLYQEQHPVKSKHPGSKSKRHEKSGTGMDYEEYKNKLKEYDLGTKGIKKEFNDQLQHNIDSINKKYHVNDYYYDTRFFLDDLSMVCSNCSFSSGDIKVIVPDQPYRLSNIHFTTGSAELEPGSYSELDELVKFLSTHPSVKIRINGHTDNSGSPSLNHRLSQDRAQAVMDYLVKKGISPSRLSCKGYGREMPLGDNNTEEGRKMNRRVEFVVVGK